MTCRRARVAKRLVLGLLLSAVCSSALGGSADCADADRAADERMAALVKLPQKAATLEDICAQLRQEVTAEFYVDRRYAATKIALHIGGEVKLKTAMTVIGAASGLEWRMVGDLFFLSPDARGAAVTRWYERYDEAKKAHLAGMAESQAKEWINYAMPFPPRFDRPWELTPLQSEQLAYQQALSVFTMTPPQLDWLDAALAEREYPTAEGQTVIDRLAEESPEIPLEINAAMIIHSPSGEFLIEMPLSQPDSSAEAARPKPRKVEPPPSDSAEEAKKTNLKEEMKGLWVTGGDLRDLAGLLKKAKAHGIDNLFLPVLESGHVIYASKRFPRDAKYRGSDVLKEAIKTAGELGIKVHAVLDATLWGDATHPLPSIANYPLVQERNLLGRSYAEQEKWQQAELALLETYTPPEMPTASEPAPEEKRVYLCPASSKAPRLLRLAAEEIASNYDVAGICLDGVDYPRSTPFILAGENLAPPFGYTLEVRREMIRANQIDPIDMDANVLRTEADMEAFALWDKFRRGKLTGLVSEVCAAFRSARSDGICSATLDMASDGPSPVHWSKIKGLDALMPFIEIQKSADEGPFTYSKEEADAATSLQKAVLKSGAVVPAITGLDLDSLAEQATALADVVKLAPPQADGLKGYVLSGDANTLASALDALGD